MNKNIFGNQEQKKGAKVVSQNEWNDLNNSITNINYGDNNSSITDVESKGIVIPSDSFFFSHVAEISADYTNAVIGVDRQEDVYPYIDTVGFQIDASLYQYDIDGSTINLSNISNFSPITNVYFPEMNYIVPDPPVDPLNGVVVGYEWILEPEVSINYEPEIDFFSYTIQYVPFSTFDQTQTGQNIYSEEYVPGNRDTYHKSGFNDDEYNLKELLEDAWDSAPSTSGVVNPAFLNRFADITLKGYTTRLPIARYDWDNDQLRLTRCVQLYFGGNIGGTNTSSGGETVFRHPFKGSILSGDVIQIAPDRANATYEFKDTITIVDPDYDFMAPIAYETGETISLSGDSYVYYELWKNGSQWESELKASEIWPPADEIVGNIYHQIGYGEGIDLSGDFTLTDWGQHMFECATIHAPDLRGEFEPWYELSGYVTIGAGTAETFNGDTYNFAEKSYLLSESKDIWLRAVSTASPGNPDVTWELHEESYGTYPGFFVSVSDSEKHFNFMIGQITPDKVYQPWTKGRIYVDNTLLTPEVAAEYTIATNKPRIMFFHDDQVTTVGDTENDKLLDAEFVEWEIRGGGNQHIVEGSAVEFYGLSQAGIDSLLTYDGVDGTNWGEGSMTISGMAVDYDIDHGLTQQLDVVDEAVINLIAGENVRIDYANGEATINSRFEVSSADFTQIEFVTDVQLLSSGLLQKKTRTAYVYLSDPESSWIDAGSLATTTCPTSGA